MKTFNIALIAFVLCIIGGFWYSAGHYHDKYQAEKKRADNAEFSLAAANATIADMTKRQAAVAALDAKYTQELNDAKRENDALRSRINAGGRVLVKGSCPVPASKTAIPSSVGDASTVQLSDIAGRNVLRIRSGIQQDQSALKALQEYIRAQCLK